MRIESQQPQGIIKYRIRRPSVEEAEGLLNTTVTVTLPDGSKAEGIVQHTSDFDIAVDVDGTLIETTITQIEARLPYSTVDDDKDGITMGRVGRYNLVYTPEATLSLIKPNTAIHPDKVDPNASLIGTQYISPHYGEGEIIGLHPEHIGLVKVIFQAQTRSIDRRTIGQFINRGNDCFVSHPMYGNGLVIDENSDGKLTVEFFARELLVPTPDINGENFNI